MALDAGHGCLKKLRRTKGERAPRQQGTTCRLRLDLQDPEKDLVVAFSGLSLLSQRLLVRWSFRLEPWLRGGRCSAVVTCWLVFGCCSPSLPR
jgi:hypothetical protein